MPHFCGHTHTRRDRRDSSDMNGNGHLERDRAPIMGHVPTREEIEVLAYSYWEARGRQGGSPWEDWFRAERELQERRTR